MIGRNDACWCGSTKKFKKCHYPQEAPQSAVTLRDEYAKKYRIILKTPEQIEGIRQSGHLAAKILEAVCGMAKAGITTQELNEYAEHLHRQAGAIAAPLRYGHPPFPKSICTSLNDVICHGIPDNTALQDGDILNVDITCILNGFYGDCSRMVCIGTVNPDRQRVVDVAYECLIRSVAILKPGVYLSDIGEIIQDYAEAHNCSVVHQFVAHGVGLAFHEAPQLPHYRNNLAIPVVPGMIFTIEPMINAGVADANIDSKDQWTARTADGKDSAQWEYTVLITDVGHEILTPWTR